MKVKNALLIAVCSLITQSALALKIEVRNMSNENIQVDPIWTGTNRGYGRIDYYFSQNTNKPIPQALTYNSHLHRVQALFVQRENGTCLAYRFQPHSLQGTGSIVIDVGVQGDFGVVYVNGYTDIVRKGGTAVQLTIPAQDVVCW